MRRTRTMSRYIPLMSALSSSGYAGLSIRSPSGVKSCMSSVSATVTCHSFRRGRRWDRHRRPDRFYQAPPGRAYRTVRFLCVRFRRLTLSPYVLCPDCPGGCVARVIVDVMLKPEIHDPQGEAVLSASHRLGFGSVTGVRQGKRFEVELAGPADETALAAI